MCIRDRPLGQSFTPALSSVGFVQFILWPVSPDGSEHTVCVNLWSGSISNGTLLASTAQTVVSNNFGSRETFNFYPPVPVTPGTTYFLQPVTAFGTSSLRIALPLNSYSGGTAYIQGTTNFGVSLWFREGVAIVTNGLFFTNSPLNLSLIHI